MEQQLTPKKNWLNLNIDDSSSDQQSPNKEQLQFQKIYDLPTESQSYSGKKDAFNATKVQKGFFVNQNDDSQFDNYEVKEKQQKQIKNKSQQQTNHQTENHDVQKEEPIKKNLIQQSLTKSESQNEQGQKSNEKSNQKNQLPSKPISEVQAPKNRKMFHLNLSDSSQENLPSSQDEQRHENQNEEKQNKKNINKDDQQKVKQQTKLRQFKKLEDFDFKNEPQYQILDQIPKDKRLRTIITRSSSVLDLLWPQFQVKLQTNGLSLLQIKKQSFSNMYNIYTKLISDKIRYFGRIQANLTKNFYRISISQNGVTDIMKAQIYFEYFSNQVSGPRYFTVYSLKSQVNIQDLVGFDASNDQLLKKYYQIQENKSKITKFHTRKPAYNPLVNGYSLDFNGRISRASIKNFIMENIQTQEEAIMFGRLDNNHFKLQISNPFSCVVGAAISMVQFQARLLE